MSSMWNCLCISIDGLHNGMIGAYGNTWIQTPTFDSLAYQSALFDRFYASSMDLRHTFADLWQFPPDYYTTLLTDDVDVFSLDVADRFEEKHPLKTQRHPRPADRIEKTHFFRNMAAAADVLKQPTHQPFLLWAHFHGFRGLWDFPIAYRKRYQVDEDPDPYSGVDVPEKAGREIDPDVRQSISEAYSGGVAVLDDALAGLLTFINEKKLDQNLIVIVMSVRGFSLGEHNFIGSNNELYGENVQLPLLISFPDGAFSGFRSQTLLQPADLLGLLQKKELPEEPNEIHSLLRIENQVLVTPDWFIYRKDTGDELYVKPDDRWEVNDVADRCPHILEQFDR